MCNYFIQLNNGFKINIIPVDNTNFISLNICLRGGSFYDGRNASGASHLLEHICFKKCGNMNQQELNAQMLRMGTEMQGKTYFDMIKFKLTADYSEFKEALNYIRNMYTPLKLSYKEFNDEKKTVLNQFEFDYPLSFAGNAKKKILNTEPWISDIKGTLSSVKKLGVNRIAEMHRNLFSAENSQLFIAGNLNHKDIAYITELFKDVPNQPAVPIKEFSYNKLFNRDDSDIIIKYKSGCFSNVFISFDIAGEYALAADLILAAFADGYASYLYNAMVDENYYTNCIYCDLDRYNAFSLMTFEFECRYDDLVSSIQLFFDCLKKFMDKLSENDYIYAQKFMRNKYLAFSESAEASANAISFSNFALGKSYASCSDIINAFQKITFSDFKEAALNIFDKSNFSCCIEYASKRADIYRTICSGLTSL